MVLPKHAYSHQTRCVRTLVAETLVLAKTHGYVEKIEDELERELQRDFTSLEDSDKLTTVTERFLSDIVVYHPILTNRKPQEIYTMILDSRISWPILTENSSGLNQSYTHIALCKNVNSSFALSTYWVQDATLQENGSSLVPDTGDSFAHIKSNTILKAICAGRSFFHRKIEVFDAFVVVVSFIMDFSFLVFLSDIDTKDFVFILAILLPWRVIRVVNSLIVSVKDHEHFRLKLVYKRKKKIQGNLRDTESLLQKYMTQVTALQRLCIMEGIEEWKIDKYLKNEELSKPPTPSKRKFKFKFEDSIFHMQGFNRAPRCSLPALDFHGIKLPSKSRISLPSVANSIKHHISKNLPSRRASLAAIELHASSKHANGDVRRRKLKSEDLGTMHEEESEYDESPSLSRATSTSGEVFGRVSVSSSVDSDRTLAEGSRHNSINADDERANIAKIQADAKRRHSESNLDKNKVSFNYKDLRTIISFKTPCGKTLTKPQRPSSSKLPDEKDIDTDQISMDDTSISFIDEDTNSSGKRKLSIRHSKSSDAVLDINKQVKRVGIKRHESDGDSDFQCNGSAQVYGGDDDDDDDDDDDGDGDGVIKCDSVDDCDQTQ
ncbi:HVCN1-like protein [Mya arenaria]|uniref:HVCN1-like protein n=1 Tax=Mya arenaria TaxID=6604 RepID=A0ABY7DYP3_MYAAR|nr:HVCN1-like protein [Mya arenaria]